MARTRNRKPANVGNMDQIILSLFNGFLDYISGGSTGLLAGWWATTLKGYMNRPKVIARLTPYVKAIRQGGTVAPQVIFDALFLPLVSEVLGGGKTTGPLANWVIGCVKNYRTDPGALKHIATFVNGIAKATATPPKARRTRTRTTTPVAETLSLE